jgi:hypothetical protein
VLYEVKPHNICEASLREQLKGMMKQGCGDWIICQLDSRESFVW